MKTNDLAKTDYLEFAFILSIRPMKTIEYNKNYVVYAIMFGWIDFGIDFYLMIVFVKMV